MILRIVILSYGQFDGEYNNTNILSDLKEGKFKLPAPKYLNGSAPSYSTKDVFIELLLIANFKDGKFEGYTVPRGSVVTSIPSLATAVGLTEMQVRTALKHLKSTGEITVKTTNKFSIITVKNYNLYQDEGKQEDKQKAIKRHAEGKQKEIKGQHLNNVTKKQCNKETSGGVCPQGTHTPPREQNGATSVTPLGGRAVRTA